MRILLFFGVIFSSLCLVKGESVSPSANSPDPWKLSLGNSKPRPKNARTIIDNDEGAWFDDATSSLEFRGNVVVRDPQFKLFCDKLYVVMNPNRQGIQKIIATAAPKSALTNSISTNSTITSPLTNPPSNCVTIEQENTNEQGEFVKTIARAGEVIYEPATGNLTLKYKPEITQGASCQIGTEENTIMILNKKGTSQTIGKSQIIVVDPNKQ